MNSDKTSINWYPGHMKKTMDMFSEEIKQVDVVLEILDARIPLSSRNPEVSKIVGNKTRIVLLNKVDLVDKNKLDIWKKYFLKTNTADYIIPISAEKGMNIKDIKSKIKELYNKKLEKVAKKGLRKTQIRSIIAGIPNVGKSRLINRLSSKSKAGVGNMPGFTRGKQWINVDDNFFILDTPGVLWPKFDSHSVAVNLAITGSIKDDVLPIEEVCIELLKKMKEYEILGNVYSAYGIEEGDDDYHVLLKKIENRLLINTKEFDYEQVSKRILKDYRQGKLGKFFLELPRKEIDEI